MVLSIKQLCLAFSILFVQTLAIGQFQCGNRQYINSLGEDYQKSLNELDLQIRKRKEVKKAGGVITIPVVVHIIHTGEDVGVGFNLSEDDINESLDHLNHAFRATNEYEGTTTDSEIQFALAVRDPNEQPTTGINRVDGSLISGYKVNGYYDLNSDQIEQETGWDSDDYVNIWVVNNFFGKEIAGFANLANFSGFTGNNIQNGIRIESEYLNTIALIHEMGHFLGLYHTFEEGESGSCPSNGDCTTDGDRVCDTDPHVQDASCGSLSEESNNLCTGNAFGKVLRNFMAYGSYYCKDIFTAGQNERMNLALEVSNRKSLLESHGLTPATSPTALFAVSLTERCIGNVTCTDQSIDGASSGEWVFEGGTPATSTEQHPIVTYNTPGTFDVSLKVSNSLGEDSLLQENLIIIHNEVLAAACTPVSSFPTNNYDVGIKEFHMKEISSLTQSTNGDHSTTPGAYLNNTCTAIARVTGGETVDFSIVVGNTNNENLNMYIDWNNDGVFNEEEEKVVSLKGIKGLQELSLTVPEISENYNTVIRMRIIDDFSRSSLTSCSSLEAGQAEDYGLIIEPEEVEPIADFIVDKAVICAGDVMFTNTSTGSPTSWTWKFEGGTPSESSELNPTVSYNESGSYEVSLTSTNAYGESRKRVTNYITVKDNNLVSACTPTGTFSSNYHGVLGVGIDDIWYSSGVTNDDNIDRVLNGYSDYTCDKPFVVDATKESVVLKMTSDDLFQSNYSVYIDQDNDGEFDDEEQVFYTTTKDTFEFSYDVSDLPVDQLLRLRFMVSSYTIFNACSRTYETEDYGFIRQDKSGQTITLDDGAVTGISSFKSDLRATIFPNPSTGFLQIETLEIPLEIQVINALGQTITVIKESKNMIDLSHLEKGVYFVNLVWTNDNEIQSIIINK